MSFWGNPSDRSLPRGTLAKPRVAIGVAGVYHSESLAVALEKCGYDVMLFPAMTRLRFKKFSRARIHSQLSGDLIMRIARRFGNENWGDLQRIQWFGKFFARQIQKEKRGFDTIVGWSSGALEAFSQNPNATKVLIRDSAHISTQFELLKKEYWRFGLTLPNRKIIENRELQEYELADIIIVLSQFAYDSFVAEGVSKEKLRILPLGANTEIFSPNPAKSVGNPIDVVYFGNLSLRKGVWHLVDAFREIPSTVARLTIIGKELPEMKGLLDLTRFQHHPHLPHAQLSELLRTMDVFVLPSLEDGFGTVIPQALASGLFTVVTKNCGGADLIQDGITGKIITPGSATAIRETILQLAKHPEQLARCKQQIAISSSKWGWDVYEKTVKQIFDSIAAIDRANIA